MPYMSSGVSMSPVAQSTLIGNALGASKVTAKVSSPSASAAVASAIDTVGGSSSSMMVPTAISSPSMT